MHQLLDGSGPPFDAGKFNWIGNTTKSPNTVAIWHTTDVRTVEDARRKEVILGATGTAGGAVHYPMIMNALLGTKFKIVMGYPGGNDVNLAMERGEIAGRGSNSWVSWKSTKPDWLKEKKIHMLVQIGLTKHPDLPDVPLLIDMAANEQDRAVLKFISADTAFARALATTPDTPADRVNALRRAFDAVMKDPDLVTEAEKAQRDLSADRGEDVQRVVLELINTAPAVIERTKGILAGVR